MNEGAGTIVPPDASRLTQAFRLIRGLLRHHKRLFFTAVSCAAVYASCTVLSSVVVRLIIDKLIVPRFENGHVPASHVAITLGLLILVGVVRAAGVVGRRMPLGGRRSGTAGRPDATGASTNR